MKMLQILFKIIFSIILVFGILLIWTREINLKALIEEPFNKVFHLKSKVEIPIIKTSMINLLMKYKEGLIIDGIVWRKDYQEFKFIVNYTNSKTELTDFKIDIQMPAGVVFYKIQEVSGFDNLNVCLNQENMGIGNNLQINKLVKHYPNHLFINALKAMPKAQLTLRLIVKPVLAHNNGFVKYNYDYINEKDVTVIDERVYLMPYIEKNDFVCFTVNSNDYIGTYDYNIALIPEEPIVFTNDGKITQ